NPIFNGFFLSVKLNKRIILNFIVVQQCLYFLVCGGQFLLGLGNPFVAAFKGTLLERNFLFQPIYLVAMLVILYIFLVVVGGFYRKCFSFLMELIFHFSQFLL